MDTAGQGAGPRPRIDPDDRIVELAIAAVGDGYQVATDLDYTALLLDRWHDVASASHHTSIGAMTRWLTAHDPARDYWAPLGGRP